VTVADIEQYFAGVTDGGGMAYAKIFEITHSPLAISEDNLKALATDSGRPAPVRGAPPGASYTFMGDEHGAIDFDPAAGSLRVGDRVELLTSHCDPTVNLHGRYAVVRGDDVLDFWPIEARY
jgi:D-serine deaminase-like pyridoxal phosphate-dependent protein